MPWLPAEIFGDCLSVIQDGFRKRIAGYQSITIGESEPGIFDGIEGNLDAKFTWAFIGDDANSTLCHADECVLTSHCLRPHMT
jgi:hypothetical protein